MPKTTTSPKLSFKEGPVNYFWNIVGQLQKCCTAPASMGHETLSITLGIFTLISIIDKQKIGLCELAIFPSYLQCRT